MAGLRCCAMRVSVELLGRSGRNLGASFAGHASRLNQHPSAGDTLNKAAHETHRSVAAQDAAVFEAGWGPRAATLTDESCHVQLRVVVDCCRYGDTEWWDEWRQQGTRIIEIVRVQTWDYAASAFRIFTC
jgi:hypothetical protein